VAEDMPLNIVFEDADIIIINKPVGLVTHPGAGNWTGTLANALLYYALYVGMILYIHLKPKCNRLNYFLAIR
jgi:23S rRNA-/tRNA-specific pseudouridylate synthase